MTDFRIPQTLLDTLPAPAPPPADSWLVKGIRSVQEAQKYSPDQPRDPAGSPTGGQWASTGGIGADAAQLTDRLASRKSFQEFQQNPQDSDITRMVAGMIKENGGDALPTVISKDEMDRQIAGGATELYRGFRGQRGKENADQFRNGDLFVGDGLSGSGVYTTVDIDRATSYSEDYWNNGALVRMALKPDARVIAMDDVEKLIENAQPPEYKKLAEEAQAAWKAFSTKKGTTEKRETELWTAYRHRRDEGPATYHALISDPAIAALLEGYDAISVRRDYVVLNRGALFVQLENMP